MAQDTINTQFDFSGFNTLKKDLRDATILYQQMVASGAATAEQIKQQAARVAELKDKIDDTNDAVKAMTGAGQFQAFGRAISAAAGGFAALQGTIALVGGESEDLQKTMVKLQAALSISQGLSQLEDLGNAFGNLKKVAVNAFNAIKTAIGSTGIGLLVVALGAIVVYWEDIKELVSGVSAEQKQLNAETAANLELNQENLAALEENENVLKLSGKSEKEIYDMKVKQYEATIDTAKAQIENLKKTREIQVETARRNKDILQGIIRLVTIPITATLKGIDLIAESLGKTLNLEEKFSGGLASLVFDPEDTKEKADETIKEAEKGLRVLENKLAGMKLKKQEEDKQAAAKAKEGRDKEREQQEKEAKELAEKLTKLRRDEALKQEDELTQELEKIDDSYEEKFQLAKGNEELTNLLLANLRAERLKKIKEFEDKEREAKEKAAKDENDAIEQRAKEQEDRTKEEYDKSLENLEIYFEQRRNKILEDFKNGKLTQEEYDTAILNLQKEQLQAEIVLRQDYNKESIDLANQLSETEIEIAKKTKEEKEQLFKDTFDTAVDFANRTVGALDAINKARTAREIKAAEGDKQKIYEIEKAAFERDKKVAIAKAIIDTLTGAVEVYMKYAAVPFIAAAMSAITIATGFAQVAAIRATTFDKEAPGTASSGGSKFAQGGLIMGPSHSQGGIKTMFGELEGGEFIVNRIAAQRFMPVLEEINSSGNTPSDRMMMPNGTQTPIVKTYVVASDMYSELEKKKKLDELARL